MRIKGFDKDLKCRDFQFEIGKEYKIDSTELNLCTDTVFHYCDSMQNVNEYYSCEEDNRYCEIEVLGEEITNGEKYGSNHIKIVREIVGEELNALLGRVNGNMGIFNSGHFNSGDRNTGDRNTGNYNSGDRNTGHFNSGAFNSGDYNSGDYNSGYYNSGDRNTGSYNSGDYNAGSYNSGSYNYRCYNTSCHNTGCNNSGGHNSGYYNSGFFNSGNWNSGEFNSCDNSAGFFNSIYDDNIKIFNKPSGMSFAQFKRSKYHKALRSSPFTLTEWIEYTDKEKKKSETKKSAGGYLKTYTYKEACKNWWKNMTDENKKIVMSMPNFDAKVFKKITGITVK